MIRCACICAKCARWKLLSREGEIAIANRLEAGREAMIAGLCESPLTFQAIPNRKLKAKKSLTRGRRPHMTRSARANEIY
jgi:hypothetical protein